MASYPPDQFDELPAELARVGAHRAPPRAGRGWITFAWAALATGILIAAGYFGLTGLRGLSFFDGSPTATPTPTVEVTADPILDPTLIAEERGISITILNGTTTVGLEQAAGEALAGWPLGALLTATNRDEEATVIYYSNPADEDVARGVAIVLGVGELRESAAFPGAPVTVVLGADFVPLSTEVPPSGEATPPAE